MYFLPITAGHTDSIGIVCSDWHDMRVNTRQNDQIFCHPFLQSLFSPADIEREIVSSIIHDDIKYTGNLKNEECFHIYSMSAP